MTFSGWTPEAVAYLRERWSAGAPASEIARFLGCSRDAVIGKARRIGAKTPVEPRSSETQRRVAQARWSGIVPPRHERRTVAKTPPQPIPATAPPKEPDMPTGFVFVEMPRRVRSERVALDELRAEHCRYPLWGEGTPPEARRYCGKPTTDEKSSWCAGCRALVYAPAAEKAKRRAA